jgi:hypothetical protein
MSLVQNEYQRLVDEMTPAQRMERSASLLAWARDLTGRMIVAEMGEMSAARLKWEIAMRHYGHEPIMRRLIERAMASVPG